MKITIRRIINSITGKILYIYYKRANIRLAKNVKFKRKPLISIHKKASLVIGNNVTINSDNYGYHLNMFTYCKLLADREGAVITIGDNTRFHGSCIHAYKKSNHWTKLSNCCKL